MFGELGIRNQREPQGGGPGLGIGLGIVNRDPDLQGSNITAPEALGEMQSVAMRVTAIIKPGFIGEADRVDNQGVALPLADRVSEPGGNAIVGKATAVGEDLAIVNRFVVEDQDDSGRLDDLPRPASYQHRAWHAAWQASRGWPVLPCLALPLLVKGCRPGLHRRSFSIRG